MKRILKRILQILLVVVALCAAVVLFLEVSHAMEDQRAYKPVLYLEDKLAQLGLSDREAADFIAFWAPRIRSHEYTFVSFDASAYTQRASYGFTDASGEQIVPDTFIRVFMTIREADASTVVRPQTLTPPPPRAGFTAVEWGGTEQL